MRREHLERLRPVCPTCRAFERDAPVLELRTVAREQDGDVVEGTLVCPHAGCGREHPIVDGIAIVVADLRLWASHQLPAVMRRDDLTAFSESLLGDAGGPGSEFDRERSNLSGYGHGHWETEEHAELVRTAAGLLDAAPAGVWADLGCAAGRGTAELARSAQLAVGVDLSFAMLRLAERVRRSGRATYPRRRIGIVYDRREVAVPGLPADRMSFWCCDVTQLPFADATFDGALSLNVVDCAHTPAAHLAELGRTLAPGAPALLSTPYDWSAAAAPPEQWLGGHSQRGPHGGAGPDALRHVLAAAGLTVEAERDGVPWRVYANERSTVHYSLHLLRLRR